MGKALRLHACGRKPRGYVVGESGGAWLLIGQETPLSPPGRSEDGTIAVGYDGATADENEAWRHLVGECADVVQAVSNLLFALGVEDFRPQMALCAARNRERGRM